MLGFQDLLNDGFRPGFVLSLDFKRVDYFLVGSPLFLLVSFCILVSYVVFLAVFVELVDSLVSSRKNLLSSFVNGPQ